MPRLTGLILCAALAGCGRGDVPTAKYFSGQPVAHWLEEAKSPDAKTRKRAIEVLGNVGSADPGAIPALTAAVKDKDPAIRDAAVLALSKIGPPAVSAEAALKQATTDRYPTVRMHAKLALGRIHEEQ